MIYSFSVSHNPASIKTLDTRPSVLPAQNNSDHRLALRLQQERIARELADDRIFELENEVLKLKENRKVATKFLCLKIKEITTANRELTRRVDSLLAANERLVKEIQDLKLANKQLSEKTVNMGVTLSWLYKQYFGHKTEKLEPKTNLSVSDDLVAAAQPKRSRGQQKDSPGHGRTDRSYLEPEEEFVDIPDCKCDVCGKPYYELRETDDSPLLEIDVKAHRRIYKRKRYVSQCFCKGKQLRTAPAPAKLYPRTNIGNSLWAYLLLWRYLHGVPVHRILQNLSLHKLPLSAGTVAGGFQKTEKLLDMLYNRTIAHCQSSSLWHADETSWRVFEENNGTRSKKQWWFWLIASNDAVIYVLDKSRSKAIPNGFFTASTGVLMTDRLASYKDLPDTIRNVWCWVHVKRDFFKIFQGVKELKNWAKDWLTEIGQLFALNHKRVQLWQLNQSLQFQEAQIAVEQHISKLKELRTKQLQDPAISRQQKKVLLSMENHWQGLTLFLTDPRIPLTNNRAERLLRPIVISRKNSYGSGKEWSGMLAAKLFTVLQTWLTNGLDPQNLLLDYLNECSKNGGKPPPDVNGFLPWLMTEERKQQFFLPKNIKRPG
jgi:transposase